MGNKCVLNQCTCQNGNGATGTSCNHPDNQVNGPEKCISCDTNALLKSNKCIPCPRGWIRNSNECSISHNNKRFKNYPNENPRCKLGCWNKEWGNKPPTANDRYKTCSPNNPKNYQMYDCRAEIDNGKIAFKYNEIFGNDKKYLPNWKYSWPDKINENTYLTCDQINFNYYQYERQILGKKPGQYLSINDGDVTNNNFCDNTRCRNAVACTGR